MISDLPGDVAHPDAAAFDNFRVDAAQVQLAAGRRAESREPRAEIDRTVEMLMMVGDRPDPVLRRQERDGSQQDPKQEPHAPSTIAARAGQRIPMRRLPKELPLVSWMQ